ncbi:hypothetical protein BQ8794_220082 [Mesorhizobium prunaredense]|uniref:Uncharacterized protein n=1 Tax=Mesorhizobium prunaredense TaxID=1631249 RepID=A0A1R3V6K4_9HYPH|nr:hypothetical protein BQ8794_220082 [Mesorhizobium prunaredense]
MPCWKAVSTMRTGLRHFSLTPSRFADRAVADSPMWAATAARSGMVADTVITVAHTGMLLSIVELGMVLALWRGPQLPELLLGPLSGPLPPHTHIRRTADIILTPRAIETICNKTLSMVYKMISAV